MQTVTTKVFTKAELADYLGISRQAVYSKVDRGIKGYAPDVKDADGVPRYFSEELALRLKSEREDRLRS